MSPETVSDFNFWISLSLIDSFSPKLGLRPKWRFSFPLSESLS